MLMEMLMDQEISALKTRGWASGAAGKEF